MASQSGASASTPRREAFHTLQPCDVYAALDAAPGGLTSTDAGARLARDGRNVLREAPKRPIFARLWANFAHLMALLLWVGGAIGFVAQMPELGVAIWLVNLINGAFSFWQEYKAEKATQALQHLLPSFARVMRDGAEQRIPAEELVRGDVMLLAEGEHISADARLVHESELRVDQSTLTGESYPVRKTSSAVLREDLARAEISNLVFAGTSVAAGTGRAVVTATAMNTEFGLIASLTQSVADELSPLQVEMMHTTRVVTLLALGIGLAFFGLAVSIAGMTLAEGFIFGLGMIVAFVPEGLLPTVTLALALGTQRMARRNALVKRLSAVETLGCASVVCTDKTGTLTENAMTARDIWLPARRMTVTGSGYQPDGRIVAADADGAVAGGDDDLRQLLLAAALCNDARLIPPNGQTARWDALGDPTEAALLVAAHKGGLDVEAESRRLPRVRELPFDSRRKRMSTGHAIDGTGPARLLFVKGAPKEVLALCTRTLVNGRAETLDDARRAEVMRVNDDYARRGLRVLAVARRALDSDLADFRADAVECDLTLLGLLALLDPPRPEVADAVQRCHRAGIRIIMITGDYGLTAESIARRVGILRATNGPPRVISGPELELMDAATLREALRGEVIFARVAPDHKLRVVTTLQAMGHVVAVTGDGVNDAPALRKADIGVAMGRAGTDVAKEAADMILTDDNFASIVNAVEEGRAVYANIRKFITYIFTSNAPEAWPFILFAFSAGRIPLALTVMQILSIDLGTDMVPALALGSEPPEPGVMRKPPRDLKAHIITWPLIARSLVLLGTVQSAAALAAFFFTYWLGGYWGQWLDLPASGPLYRSATAMTLAAVVATQIGNLFAQRTELGSILSLGAQRLLGNRLIWIGILIEVGLLTAIVYVPAMQTIFGTAAFPATHWLFLLALTPVLLVVDEARKACARRRAGRGP